MATAVHEAGHALVAFLTAKTPAVRKVTIRGAGPAKGYTSFHNEREQADMTQAEVRGMMDVALGGRVAEELFLGADQVSSGCSDDLKKATQFAYSLLNLEQGGLVATLDPKAPCSDRFRFEVDEKATRLLE
jgi:ATP-dependent metalloprotease